MDAPTKSKSPITLYHILYYFSKYMKYTGVGVFWFEEPEETQSYKIYKNLIFIAYYLIVFLEGLEAVFNTYPNDLHNDAVTFVLAHVVVIIRIRIIIYHKLAARGLAHDFIEVCKQHEDDDVRHLQYRKVKNLVFLQLFSIIGAMASFVIEAIRRMGEGLPFIPVVTYYPAFEDNSHLALAIRVIILIVQFSFLCNMMSCDNVAIGYLIFLSCKFITLRKYFENMTKQNEINRQVMPKEEAAKWFKERCLEGFKMHRELLRLTKVVYDVFGTVMSIQVVESIVVIIQILLRITLSAQLTYTAVMMNLLFIMALLVALGLYSLNGGEITYQASLISSSIFYSGWHKYEMEQPTHNDVRRMILMGIAQAQRPVSLKVFGVHMLSYETFVSVIRVTYSLYAILH